MLAVTVREHCRNGKRRCCMTGRKTRADTSCRSVAFKKRVGETSTRRNVRRPQPPRCHLERDLHHRAVCIGLAGKQRRLLRIGILSEVSSNQECHRNQRNSCSGDSAGENVVESFEASGTPEVRRVVGISRDQDRRGPTTPTVGSQCRPLASCVGKSQISF